MYIPERVAGGELLRLLTHPFVHVSGYHFLLDGAAFILLYNQLSQRSLRRRLAALLVIHAAVTFAVTLSLPFMPVDTYGGLSGIAHGLMALCGLEMTVHRDRAIRQAGGLCFAIVLIKSFAEALTGGALFGSLHLGSVGVPIVWAHLGGVMGALFVFVVWQAETAKSREGAGMKQSAA